MNIKQKRLLAAIAVTIGLVALGTPGWGENAGPGLYKVKKGDTLWGISHGQIKDSWQWPFVWRENPKIENPDRIYPGQEIKIPVVPSGGEGKAACAVPARPAAVSKTTIPLKPAVAIKEAKKTSPVKKTAMPVKHEKRYLFSENEIISSGFIAKEIRSDGVVMASPGGREIFAVGDDLYIEPSGPVSKGEKFLVTRVSKVNDPVTGEFAGYLVEPRGLARVESPVQNAINKEGDGTAFRAAVTRTFEGILPGNLLLNYREPENAPRGAGRKPMVEGHVLALKGQALVGAEFGIAYLNKGSAAGLKPGDLLETISGYKKNALLQIISVRPETATAVIRESRTVVRPGDRFGAAE
ncbi:MAG: LysM peptidoglycan-binding domain-containing protein [Nitrospiraceae bacterium]|nr:LysM peptidoglycan-binding domain-containing protein [Nitrospiraceae bacterium]